MANAPTARPDRGYRRLRASPRRTAGSTGRDDADGDEVAERGAGDLDERGREERLALVHPCILAMSPCRTPTRCTVERVFGSDGTAADEHSGAVAHDGGHLLIVAGAGSGQDDHAGVAAGGAGRAGALPAERILLLTFSRRAACELLRRAEAEAGHDVARRTWGGTFHAVANRLLRRHGWAVGLDPAFTVLDQADTADLLAMVRSELAGLGSPPASTPVERRRAKKDTMAADPQPRRQHVDAAVAGAARDRSHGASTSRPSCAPPSRRTGPASAPPTSSTTTTCCSGGRRSCAPPPRRRCDAQFDHVLVDEYQDTNAQQADLLFELASGGASDHRRR